VRGPTHMASSRAASDRHPSPQLACLQQVGSASGGYRALRGKKGNSRGRVGELLSRPSPFSWLVPGVKIESSGRISTQSSPLHYNNGGKKTRQQCDRAQCATCQFTAWCAAAEYGTATTFHHRRPRNLQPGRNLLHRPTDHRRKKTRFRPALQRRKNLCAAAATLCRIRRTHHRSAAGRRNFQPPQNLHQSRHCRTAGNARTTD
jgi:hypothetical protein